MNHKTITSVSLVCIASLFTAGCNAFLPSNTSKSIDQKYIASQKPLKAGEATFQLATAKMPEKFTYTYKVNGADDIKVTYSDGIIAHYEISSRDSYQTVLITVASKTDAGRISWDSSTAIINTEGSTTRLGGFRKPYDQLIANAEARALKERNLQAQRRRDEEAAAARRRMQEEIDALWGYGEHRAPSYSVTVASISDEFEANSIVAEDKYMGKMIELRFAYINSVDDSVYGDDNDVSVTLQGKPEQMCVFGNCTEIPNFEFVTCNHDRSEPIVRRLSKGKEVVVRGRVESESSGVELADCKYALCDETGVC